MVNIGDTYRKVIADENCLIEVKAIDGIYVLGEVVNEPLTIGGIPLPSDHAGQEVSDLREHVEKRVASARAWDQMTRRHNKAVKDFWESVQTGDTLHYRHFHGQFYRGTAVQQSDGQMAMQVTSLVGDWPAHTLPRRDACGEVRTNPTVRKVMDGEIMRPNASLIFESPEYSGSDRDTDPRTLPEVDLTLPDPTPEEQDRINLERLLREVREASEEGGHPQERLDKIKALLPR